MKKWSRSYWAVGLGVILSVAGWYGAYRLWALLGYHPKGAGVAFRDFMDIWGAALGIVATIVVGIFAAAIPSRVEARVEDIAERMQQPLLNFPAIYAKTLELLNWVREEPGSVFLMTSATPVFGIELDESDRDRWANALNRRIVTRGPNGGQPKTSLFCLSPSTDQGATASPLWEFCCELEKSGHLKGKQVHTADQPYLRSKNALDKFAALATHSDSKGFELRCGPTPPIHFVLAQNAERNSKGILYFPGVASPREGLVVPGFETEDERWIGLIKVVYEYVKSQSWDVLGAFQEDSRTKEQKARCDELLQYQLQREHRSRYDVVVGGYHVVVDPDVFPPEIGIGTTQLLEALKEVGGILSGTCPGQSLLGIDVGTGTGILSIALAEYCSEVYATDISSAAVKNARENTYRATEGSGGARRNINVLRGNLLEPLPELDRSAVFVVVFNYPFYPSPLAVYNPAGKDTAGINIVREFFGQVGRVGDNSVIIMPYSTIAGEHNPATVAREKGFGIVTLLEGSDRGSSVYAFTKSTTILDALRAAEKPVTWQP